MSDGPAHQRLETGDAPVGERYDGLVDRQAAFTQGCTQKRPPLQGGSPVRCIDVWKNSTGELAASGLVQGVVGVAQQGFGIVALHAAHGDADAAMGVQFALGRWGGEGGQFDQGFCDAQRLRSNADSVQQHGELVAADARGDIASRAVATMCSAARRSNSSPTAWP